MFCNRREKNQERKLFVVIDPECQRQALLSPVRVRHFRSGQAHRGQEERGGDQSCPRQNLLRTKVSSGFTFPDSLCPVLLQQRPLNVITSGQMKSDNIKREAGFTVVRF